VVSFSTSPNLCSYTTWGNKKCALTHLLAMLFQQSVSALKPDIARRVESMIEIILLRSGLLQLPGFMVLRKDYDCNS